MILFKIAAMIPALLVICLTMLAGVAVIGLGMYVLVQIILAVAAV